MTDNQIWGLILIAYVLPWGAWTFSREQTLQARRKLYPGRKDEELLEGSTTRIGLCLAAGLGLLLLAWKFGWHPIPTVILLGAIAAAAFAARRLFRTRTWPPLSAHTRFWVAGSALWLLSVAAWYLVFGDDSSLDERQFAMVGIFPPVVSWIGLVLFRWASGKPIRSPASETDRHGT